MAALKRKSFLIRIPAIIKALLWLRRFSIEWVCIKYWKESLKQACYNINFVFNYHPFASLTVFGWLIKFIFPVIVIKDTGTIGLKPPYLLPSPHLGDNKFESACMDENPGQGRRHKRN